jgi:hypothetical protein
MADDVLTDYIGDLRFITEHGVQGTQPVSVRLHGGGLLFRAGMTPLTAGPDSLATIAATIAPGSRVVRDDGSTPGPGLASCQTRSQRINLLLQLGYTAVGLFLALAVRGGDQTTTAGLCATTAGRGRMGRIEFTADLEVAALITGAGSLEIA